MRIKETAEETEQQKEAFIKHLNEASEVVASWEPWERGILGIKRNGTLVHDTAAVECANNGSANEINQPEENNREE